MTTVHRTEYPFHHIVKKQHARYFNEAVRLSYRGPATMVSGAATCAILVSRVLLGAGPQIVMCGSSCSLPRGGLVKHACADTNGMFVLRLGHLQIWGSATFMAHSLSAVVPLCSEKHFG